MTELSPAVSRAYDVKFTAAYGANVSYDTVQETPNTIQEYESSKRNHKAPVSITGAVFARIGILPPEYRPIIQPEIAPLPREILTEMIWVDEDREVEAASASAFGKFAQHHGYQKIGRLTNFFSSFEKAVDELEQDVADGTHTVIDGEEGRGISVGRLREAMGEIRSNPGIVRSLRNSSRRTWQLFENYADELDRSLEANPAYDGTPIREKVSFGLDGEMYKLFVPPEEAARLRSTMDQWTPHARKTGENSSEPTLDDTGTPPQDEVVFSDSVQVVAPVEVEKPARARRERNVQTTNLWANFGSEFIDKSPQIPSSESASADSYGKYLEEIAQCAPLLNQEGEIELGQRIQAGNDAARRLEAHEEYMLSPEEAKEYAKLKQRGLDAEKMLAEANLRLVVAIAKTYKARTNEKVDLIDLIQEGNIKLLAAVKSFDPSRGCKFSTHAFKPVRQGVTRALANQSRTIRVPLHVDEALTNYYIATKELTFELGADPTSADIAGRMGIDTAKVEELEGYLHLDPISLSTPDGEDDDLTLGDKIKSDQAVEDRGLENITSKLIRQKVLEAISDDRLRQIISMRYGFGGDEPMERREVGEHFGITRERVRQLENEALLQLREYTAEFRELS